MNASRDFVRNVDELAAHWTEPVLAILKSLDFGQVTVELELETWRAVKIAIRRELRWQRVFRASTLVSLSRLLGESLAQAVMSLFRTHRPERISYRLEARVRQMAAERRATGAERNVFVELVRGSGPRAGLKAPSVSDFVPRLRLSAVAN
jgi:hypothetical protein